VTGIRRVIAVFGVACGVLAAWAPGLRAAAEVHRLSLVVSSNPTQIVGGDFNDFLSTYNRTVLAPRGLETLEKITTSWYYQAELRFFVRPNVAVSAGLGQIRSSVHLEYLPRISQSIEHRAEVLTVPVHVGAAYYLAPYNQGDFQARAYLGGGFMSYTANKAIFERTEAQTDTATTLGGNFKERGDRDAPGYYLEVGAHMFFAVRYSVMLGVIYRNALIRNLALTIDSTSPDGRVVTHRTLHTQPTLSLDMGGVGARMALGIGF